MLFKYPKLRRIGDAFAQAIREETEGVSPDELEEQTRQKLAVEGLFGAVEGGFDGNVENLIEEKYTDEDVTFDSIQVNWEKEYMKM